MVTIKFHEWQFLAIRELVQRESDERRRCLESTRSMRRFYTKKELSDKDWSMWMAGDQAKLDELVDILRLFETAYEDMWSHV